MVRRKEVAVVGVAAAGLAVTARVVMGMLRRSHSGSLPPLPSPGSGSFPPF